MSVGEAHVSISALLARHGLRADKSLGQHFLTDQALLARIARYAGALNDVHVIEIGPGPSGLTRALLAERPKRLTVIEKDERFLPILQELAALYPDTMDIRHEDALHAKFAETTGSPRAIVANLPYNVATPLLIGWLEDIARLGASAYRSLTLMFQKEVAERVLAEPNSKDYGRLSVLTQWLCEGDWCLTLPPGAFVPPPKVESAVIRLVPRTNPLPCSWKSLETVLKAGFGQRRKMLRGALKSLNAPDLLARAGINGEARAETLSVADWVRLANTYASFQRSDATNPSSPG